MSEDLLRAKFEQLKRQKEVASRQNLECVKDELVERNADLHSKATHKNEWKVYGAKKLKEKIEADDAGIDYKRMRSLTYTVDECERWRDKEEENEHKKDKGFTDYNQLSIKKYQKLTDKINPNLSDYRSSIVASKRPIVNNNIELEDKSHRDEQIPDDNNNVNIHTKPTVVYVPSMRVIDRMASDLMQQQTKRKKFSKKRNENPEDDVTYINDRNKNFNQKISRFYDKYTEVIKENFERGTAI